MKKTSKKKAVRRRASSVQRHKAKSNEQARIRMARFRKRQRTAWQIVTSPKELARLTPRARKAIRAAMTV